MVKVTAQLKKPDGILPPPQGQHASGHSQSRISRMAIIAPLPEQMGEWPGNMHILWKNPVQIAINP